MTEADRELQARVRRFVDEQLIPHEVEAEMNDGHLADDVVDGHRKLARELGIGAITMPKVLGGDGLTMFQQTLVQEQIGRVTNGLGWVVHTPPAWLAGVATDHQLETWVKPSIRGERMECWAITEEGAGSDVGAITATVRRDGDGYVLDGEKWHVTSGNIADHVFFESVDAEGDELAARIRQGTLEMADPEPTSMFDHVYAEQTPPLAAQRAEFVEYHASFEGEK